MIALVLAGFGIVMQAPCATVDQHDEGWALVSFPDGTLAEIPLPDIKGGSFEGARVCAGGLRVRPEPISRSRPVLAADTTLEDLFR